MAGTGGPFANKGPLTHVFDVLHGIRLSGTEGDAAGEGREVAVEAGREPHEACLERREPIGQAEPGLAQTAHRGPGTGEQMPEAAQHRLHQGVVAAPPALVAAQCRPRPDVPPEPACPADDLGEGRRVEQPQVHALSGERMHDVGGVAGQRDPVADVVPGVQMA